MARRSITNDRYRVEQKGKTRKSASSAKPKREVGAAASDAPAKKPVKKGGATKWGRGPAREPVPSVPVTPEMRTLRRYWWILIGAAVVLAVAMIPAAKYKNSTLNAVLLGTYAAALGGSLYLEFGPLKRARQAAAAAAKGKGGKQAKAAKSAAPVPAAPETPKPQSLAGKVLQAIVGRPKSPGGGEAATGSPEGDASHTTSASNDES